MPEQRPLVNAARRAIRDVAISPELTSRDTSKALDELKDYINFWQEELKEEQET